MSHPTRQQLDTLAKEIREKLDPSTITVRERLQIPPMEMPSQHPHERVCNMDEVALGYTENQVIVESLRCLQCKNAPCVAAVR